MTKIARDTSLEIEMTGQRCFIDLERQQLQALFEI